MSSLLFLQRFVGDQYYNGGYEQRKSVNNWWDIHVLICNKSNPSTIDVMQNVAAISIDCYSISY